MNKRKISSPDVHLNLSVRGLTQSAALAINERGAALRAQGKQIYMLGLGQSPFPIPQVIVDELKANAHQRRYLPVRGLPQLREAVADYVRRTSSVDHRAQDVLVGPGSKELIFILQLVYYGDLIIPTPAWTSYAPQAHMLDRQIHWLHTDAVQDWRLMPEDLDALCRTDPSRPRIVTLNYPSNPSGCTYTQDELKALARVARQYRLIVLSDEVYGELHHRGQHTSIARFYPEGTIISGGLSKWCGAGGWRLGTFVFPRSLQWLLEAMAVVASETYTSTSAPIQYAAVRAFQGGMEIEHYLTQVRRVLRALGRHCARQLRDAGVRVAEPRGAFYLFPDFTPVQHRLENRGIHTSEALCERLLEERGVALLPGSAFGRPAQELCARLAYVDFDGARALVAAEQTPVTQELEGAFLEHYCNNVITAVNKMCDWISG